MLGTDEALGVDFVDVLGARRPRGYGRICRLCKTEPEPVKVRKPSRQR